MVLCAMLFGSLLSCKPSKTNNTNVDQSEKKEQEYKKNAIQTMDFYGADLNWRNKAKTTISFANNISQKKIAFKGILKDVFYDNGNVYALIYDWGNGDNAFIVYARLTPDQISILNKKPKARGYFAVFVEGVLSGKPDFSNSSDVETSPTIVKTEGEMLGFYLRS